MRGPIYRPSRHRNPSMCVQRVDVYFWEIRDTVTIDSKLLVIPYKNVNNFIFDRHFAINLDVVVSSVHLKLKYNNMHDKPTKINNSLSREKKIYKAL